MISHFSHAIFTYYSIITCYSIILLFCLMPAPYQSTGAEEITASPPTMAASSADISSGSAVS